VFVPGMPFKPSIMFETMAGAYHFSGIQLCGRLLERPDRDKHSSLLQTFTNYAPKSFKTLGAGVNVIRLFKVLFTPLSVYFNIILTEVTPIKA